MGRITSDEVVEPLARLVAERPPVFAERPVARRVAAGEGEVHLVAGHVGMRTALLRIENVLAMVVVDHHRALLAEQFDAVGLAENGVIGRQRVADADVDDGTVGQRDDRPGHVVHVVAGLLEDAVLRARHHLDRRIAFVVPEHEIDEIGKHVDHRGRLRIALENLEGLRAGVVDPRGATGDAPEVPVENLLLGPREAALEATDIAHPQMAVGLAHGGENLVGVGQREAERLLHQHRLSQLERAAHRLDVHVLRRGDDHRIDARIVDHRVVVGGMQIGAGALRERLRRDGIDIGNRQKADGRMPRRQPCA